jgi:hypothetical protein
MKKEYKKCKATVINKHGPRRLGHIYTLTPDNITNVIKNYKTYPKFSPTLLILYKEAIRMVLDEKI